MRIKHLVMTAILATALFCSAGFVKAETATYCMSYSSVGDQITCLTNLITQLTQQIAQTQAQQGGTTPTAWCHTFNTNLGYANSGSAEVGYLHTALDGEGISYSADTSSTYGESTMSAVVQFQQKYSITPLSGYVGPLTRAKLNLLYGCSTTLSCSDLYWFDSDDANCSAKKQFCGAYMYQGLHTYQTQQECFSGVINYQTTCTPNWTCNWGPCVDGWQQKTAIDSNNCGVSSASAIADCTDLSKQACTSPTQPSIMSTQPSITVSSPNGGETWGLGTAQYITWTGSNLMDRILHFPNSPTPKHINIVLTNSSGVKITIASDVIVDPAGYSWSIPKSLSPGRYKITVSTIAKPSPYYDEGAYVLGTKSYSDTSDDYFDIVEPSLTIISPSGGEQWARGTTHTISWISTVTGLVSISLSSSASGTPTLIAGSLPASGSYSWTIPQNEPLGSIYRIRVMSVSFNPPGSLIANEFSNSFSVIVPTSADTISTVPTCTSWTYSDWTPATCPYLGIQTRTIATSSPVSCMGGNPSLTRTCTYITPVLNPAVVAITSLTFSNSVLRWNTQNASTCTLGYNYTARIGVAGKKSEVVNISGSRTISDREARNFTLVCEGINGGLARKTIQ